MQATILPPRNPALCAPITSNRDLGACLIANIPMKDLLEAVKTTNDALEWAAPTQAVTGYVFAAAVFWIFCFSMSRYSLFWERRLNTGHKR